MHTVIWKFQKCNPIPVNHIRPEMWFYVHSKYFLCSKCRFLRDSWGWAHRFKLCVSFLADDLGPVDSLDKEGHRGYFFSLLEITHPWSCFYI